MSDVRTHRVVLVALILAAAATARAQDAPRVRPRPEARLDYLGPRPHAIQAGFGVNAPLGTYVRVGFVGAGGVGWNAERSGASLRADVIARFAFDPFRERRWGVSLGGGLSLRHDSAVTEGSRWRPLLALVADLEGPTTGPIAPAIQLGLGGGARVGIVVRWADRERR